MSIKKDNYLTIQGWMITELNLKGNELLVYALIYGFTQEENQWFEGSRQYVADWCNSSTRCIQKVINNLVNKNLIEKKEIIINNVKFCKYKTIKEDVSKFTPREQSSLPPREQSSYNNNNNNNKERKKETPIPFESDRYAFKKGDKYKDYNKDYTNKERKKEGKKSFDEIIESYTGDEQLREVLKEHLKVRKAKKALVDTAIEKSLKELDKLGANDNEKIKIVEASVINCWVGFFALKKQYNDKLINNRKTIPSPKYEIEGDFDVEELQRRVLEINNNE